MDTNENLEKWRSLSRLDDGGWRHTVYVCFGNFSWARRLLGGKWELWGHDLGTVHAVLTWHWVNDWSDTALKDCSHVVMKRWYVKGRRLSHIDVLLNKKVSSGS